MFYGKSYPFAAFITNLGKYNEGELVGEWVKFPTSRKKIKEVMKRIGIGHGYEEWFITDYDCYVSGLCDKLGEYQSLDELNYLASVLDEMSEDEFDKFEAVMEAGRHCSSVQDIINLAQNLDYYDVYPDIKDYDDLGRYLVNEVNAIHVPEELIYYIDYEAYGRDEAVNMDGVLTDHGYVVAAGGLFYEEYDGTRDDIPEEYLVTFAPDEEDED